MDPQRTRGDEHLVEPLFAALWGEAGGPAPEEPSGSQAPSLWSRLSAWWSAALGRVTRRR